MWSRGGRALPGSRKQRAGTYDSYSGSDLRGRECIGLPGTPGVGLLIRRLVAAAGWLKVEWGHPRPTYVCSRKRRC